MAIRWSFFSFDWVVYQRIERLVKQAKVSGNFDSLEFDGIQEALETVSDDATPEETANAIITDICGVGEPVIFESGLSDMILRMRRERNGVESAEILGELMSSSPGIQDWYAVDNGMVGVLTIRQTQALASSFIAFRQSWVPPSPPHGLGALKRHFASSENPEEILPDLMDLVEAATSRGEGIGVMREG